MIKLDLHDPLNFQVRSVSLALAGTYLAEAESTQDSGLSAASVVRPWGLPCAHIIWQPAMILVGMGTPHSRVYSLIWGCCADLGVVLQLVRSVALQLCSGGDAGDWLMHLEMPCHTTGTEGGFLSCTVLGFVHFLLPRSSHISPGDASGAASSGHACALRLSSSRMLLGCCRVLSLLDISSNSVSTSLSLLHFVFCVQIYHLICCEILWDVNFVCFYFLVVYLLLSQTYLITGRLAFILRILEPAFSQLRYHHLS